MRSLLKWVVPGIAVLCTALNALAQDIVAPAAQPKVFSQEGKTDLSNESVAAFMPNQKIVYIADGQTIVVSKKSGSKWNMPVTAPFSGQWKDWDPALSPDGKRLVFVSNRPLDGMPQDKPQKDNHLWYVDRLSGDNWSKPKHFDAPVNSEGFNDYGPSVSGLGTICFCSRNRDGNKGMRGYYVKWLGDHYDKPKMLSLNGDNEIFDPFIAPDEHYIIFVSNGDLYISYRKGDDWSQGQKLGLQVNNGKGNFDPYIAPDGKTLYYSQDKAPRHFDDPGKYTEGCKIDIRMDILVLIGLLILGCFFNFIWEPGAKPAYQVARAYLGLTIILTIAAGLFFLAGIKSAPVLSSLRTLMKYGGYLSNLMLGFLMVNILFKVWIKDSISENGYLVALVRTALWGASILTGAAFITETFWNIAHFGKMDRFFTGSGYAVWFLYFIIAAEFLGGLGILLNFKLKTGPLSARGLMLIMLGAVYTHFHNHDPFSNSYGAVNEFISLMLLLIMYYFEKQINRKQGDTQIYVV